MNYLKYEINDLTYYLCIKKYEIIFLISYDNTKKNFDYYIINDNEIEFNTIKNYIIKNNIKNLNEKIINDIKSIIFN